MFIPLLGTQDATLTLILSFTLILATVQVDEARCCQLNFEADMFVGPIGIPNADVIGKLGFRHPMPRSDIR